MLNSWKNLNLRHSDAKLCFALLASLRSASLSKTEVDNLLNTLPASLKLFQKDFIPYSFRIQIHLDKTHSQDKRTLLRSNKYSAHRNFRFLCKSSKISSTRKFPNRNIHHLYIALKAVSCTNRSRDKSVCRNRSLLRLRRSHFRKQGRQTLFAAFHTSCRHFEN